MELTKEIIDIIKSGNFTIIGWDNGSLSLYKGKTSVEKVGDKEPIYVFDYYGSNGYVPEAVEVLTKILGGKTDSI